MRSGRLGQTILLGLRRRVFDHFQRLSPSFHDKYTSGRVISRLTSDVDVIDEMLETGFDGLVTALLTLIGTSSCCSRWTSSSACWRCCRSRRCSC